MNRLGSFIAQFDGRILQRGFWLYVWTISHQNEEFLYVGRTGDSSSKYASSPFSRIGQHLDLRAKAKANSLLRNIREKKLEPTSCKFELFAIGPLFDEQADMASHRKHRDIVAPLEAALASYLKAAGYQVLGTHGSRKPLDESLFREVLAIVNERFTRCTK
ncbi:MAG: hypothetical protein EXS05_14835 [Planctomycetaceae bacterium]|nr:hypothetical protein [Planctomycetaceae bacterium]